MPAERLGALTPALSIVIPAYNEAERLPASLARLRAYLVERAGPTEVIVVDNGSTDGTAAIAERLAEDWPALRVVREPLRGKGAAVRAGVLAARGDCVALADADFSMPPEEFGRFGIERLGAREIAIGSREAAGARRYDEPWHRHLMGRGFNRLVQALLLPGIQDTQCGFKCLRRDVAVALCQRQTITGWGFDVELLYIARLAGYRVREVPVSWYYVRGSRVRPLRDTVSMARDVLAVRRNGQQRRYALPALAAADITAVR